jgi:hypothetical protein
MRHALILYQYFDLIDKAYAIIPCRQVLRIASVMAHARPSRISATGMVASVFVLPAIDDESEVPCVCAFDDVVERNVPGKGI